MGDRCIFGWRQFTERQKVCAPAVVEIADGASPTYDGAGFYSRGWNLIALADEAGWLSFHSVAYVQVAVQLMTCGGSVRLWG